MTTEQNIIQDIINKYRDLINLTPNFEKHYSYPKITDLVKANYGFYYTEIGKSYNLWREKEKAIECHKKAVELSPSTTSYYWLAEAYNTSDDLDKKIAAYKKAIELDTRERDVLEALEGLGVVYFMTDKHNQALACYEKLLEKQWIFSGGRKHRAHLFYMLAVCYEDVERYEDAKEAYTKSYQIDPDEDVKEHLKEIEKKLENI